MRDLAPVFSVRMFKDSQCCESELCWNLICWFNDETGRCFRCTFMPQMSCRHVWHLHLSVCKRSQRTSVTVVRCLIQLFILGTFLQTRCVQSRHLDTSRSHYVPECAARTRHRVAAVADLHHTSPDVLWRQTISLSQQVGPKHLYKSNPWSMK